jgi:hypothetical protein
MAPARTCTQLPECDGGLLDFFKRLAECVVTIDGEFIGLNVIWDTGTVVPVLDCNVQGTYWEQILTMPFVQDSDGNTALMINMGTCLGGGGPE